MANLEELLICSFENNVVFPSDFKWDNVLFSPEEDKFYTCDGG